MRFHWIPVLAGSWVVHNAQFCSIFTGVRVPRGDKETVLDRTYCRDNYNGRSFISVICFGRSGPLVVTSHDFVYATRPLLGLYARDKRASQLYVYVSRPCSPSQTAQVKITAHLRKILVQSCWRLGDTRYLVLLLGETSSGYAREEISLSIFKRQ